MAEYIKREAAYEDFEKCNSENPKWTPGRVKTLIARQKTTDVAPVRHGQWISLTECANEGVYCSICKKKVWKSDYAWCSKKSRNKLRSNYCPNCGAMMDGGADDG